MVFSYVADNVAEQLAVLAEKHGVGWQPSRCRRRRFTSGATGATICLCRG